MLNELWKYISLTNNLKIKNLLNMITHSEINLNMKLKAYPPPFIQNRSYDVMNITQNFKYVQNRRIINAYE